MHTLVSIGRFLYRCYYQRRKQEKGQRPILNQQERAHKYQFFIVNIVEDEPIFSP